MKHIREIYPMVNQVRQRIIKTMQERGIVIVQFCPKEEDYEHDHAKDVNYQEYGDYRDEHCPYVVHFDKYGAGYDYCVMQVSLIGGEHPRFKLECEGEYDNETFTDDDVQWLTMLNVYEMLEKELGLDEEPEKTWVLFDESLYDYELQGRRIMVFKSEDEARKKFKEFADQSRKFAKDNGWEIGNDNDDFFEAYPEGSWGTSHETVELSETMFNDAVWCHE
ncbi:MAG: hypothetical protein PUC18_13260 [Prevotellaceae bacterium]|nr:hypothetical protein [Prevotellaceae bacterium]